MLGTPISTRNYGYATDSWKDRLISYNGKTFTYDTIGNPLSDGTWSYTWQQGRQLVKMEKTGEKWEFAYDADGLRTQRKRGTLIYNYVYSDGVLRQMTCGTNKLVFAYGVDGRPYAVQYNGTYYYYLLNLQGDVVGIVNASGTQVVTYTYDAWGNILSTSGSMASTLGQMNPLRYRGYVYDTETGLYYVQTRYYNPEIGRWINADDPAYLGADGTHLSYNLFAYCQNNPTNKVDPSGEWTFSIGFSFSAVLFGGNTYSVVLSFDSSGGIALQTSKADVTQKESGGTFGVGSLGLSIVASSTSYDSVDDLEGTSFSAGGSKNVGFYSIGGEVITPVDMNEVVGGTLSFGVGIGIDVHAAVSVTKTHFKTNKLSRKTVLWD